jgi:hypothetical protein
MGDTRSTHGRDEKFVKITIRKFEGPHHLGDVGVGG